MIQRLQARRNEEGFTLVELLVVIVILGVLASIVVFAVGGITNNSSKSAACTDKASVSAAEEAYYAQNTHYTDMNGLTGANLLHANSSLVTISFPVSGQTAANATSYAVATPGQTCP